MFCSIISDEERANLRVIEPAGFEEEATSEYIIAGPAMTRRAMFMYGKRMERDERGHAGTGLGKGPAFGTFGFAPPTDPVSRNMHNLYTLWSAKVRDARIWSAFIITFTDLQESYLLTLQNSVLHNRLASEDARADATLTLMRPLFVDLLVGNAGLKELLFSDDIRFEGSRLDLIGFFSMLDKSEGRFNVVTP